MSQADRFEEEIGWLKVITGVCIAIDASLIAWLVRNYEPNSLPVTLAALATLDVTALIVAMAVRVYRCLEVLEGR